jgi:hypothetical protein
MVHSRRFSSPFVLTGFGQVHKPITNFGLWFFRPLRGLKSKVADQNVSLCIRPTDAREKQKKECFQNWLSRLSAAKLFE